MLAASFTSRRFVLSLLHAVVFIRRPANRGPNAWYQIRTVCKDPAQQALAEAKLRADCQARQLEDLRRAVGFRRVVDEVFNAGKPVITHNGLLVRFLQVVFCVSEFCFVFCCSLS